MHLTDVQQAPGVQSQVNECRLFANSEREAQPITRRGVGLPDELWLLVLGFLCVTFACGPQIQDRLMVFLPDLAEMDDIFARDYDDVVLQRNLLR